MSSIGWFDEFVECDAAHCSARVQCFIAKGDLHLSFCKHHYYKHEKQLVDHNWKVVAQAGVFINKKD